MGRRSWNRCVHIDCRHKKRSCNTRSLQLRIRRTGIYAERYCNGISDVEDLCSLNPRRHFSYSINRRWSLGCCKLSTLRDSHRRYVDLCRRNFPLPKLRTRNGADSNHDCRSSSISSLLSDICKAFHKGVLPRPCALGDDSCIRICLGSPCN